MILAHRDPLSRSGLKFAPLPNAAFGVKLTLDGGPGAIDDFVDAGPEILARFYDAGGLMVVRGMAALIAAPERFAEISRIFGPEVENYRETLTAERFFHDTNPHIIVLSNLPPCGHPPPPRVSRDADGTLPVQFPAQKNWHTDQSYRRPPPDVSLLLGVAVPPSDQGQTLYADCAAAYDVLDRETKARIGRLNGIHAMGWIGRAPDDVRAGVTPKPLLPHQEPRRHPLVRTHPVTGRPAVYVCEEKQMDHVDGPIEGLEPGPDGAGARLLRFLLRHASHPRFTYTHEWQPGDLVINDNRCLLHAATWYDAARHARVMWRTTVMGDPGDEYRGEAKSWIPAAGYAVMEGMEDA